MSTFNAREANLRIIEEFRANEGRVGGRFEGAPMVVVHHRGRKSSKDYINPLMYLPDDSDPNVIYIFASKGGHRVHPSWYHNLVAAGRATVEVGTETYEVDVEEVTGGAREAVYAEQASRYPSFGEYARKTHGIRVIPVLRLQRRST